MSPAPTSTTVDAWLAWFATEKQAACRAFLCARYHLNALDAEALMNTACLQVCRHWETVEHPLAYFWQALTHAVGQEGQRRSRARRQLAAYVQQRRLQAHGAARTAAHLADVLERVSPRQRRLLAWYAAGYADAQVAAWLQTTPQAVRVQRHRLLRTLQAHLGPAGGQPARRPGGQQFF